jgi:hypothetical protein
LKTPGLRHADFKPADHVHGPTLDSRQTPLSSAILSQNQGYERDARSARFSTEVPQFSDNAALIRRQKEKAPVKTEGFV